MVVGRNHPPNTKTPFQAFGRFRRKRVRLWPMKSAGANPAGMPQKSCLFVSSAGSSHFHMIFFSRLGPRRGPAGDRGRGLPPPPEGAAPLPPLALVPRPLLGVLLLPPPAAGPAPALPPCPSASCSSGGHACVSQCQRSGDSAGASCRAFFSEKRPFRFHVTLHACYVTCMTRDAYHGHAS